MEDLATDTVTIFPACITHSQIFTDLFTETRLKHFILFSNVAVFSSNLLLTFNPLTPELNPSTQRCLTRFYWDFAS
jgi:hypothetical protein